MNSLFCLALKWWNCGEVCSRALIRARQYEVSQHLFIHKVVKLSDMAEHPNIFTFQDNEKNTWRGKLCSEKKIMCVWTKRTLCLNEGRRCKRCILNVLFWKISYIEELNWYRAVSPFPSNNFEQVQTLYSTVAAKKFGNFTKSGHSDVKSLLYFEDTQDTSHKSKGAHDTHDSSLYWPEPRLLLKVFSNYNVNETILIPLYYLSIYFLYFMWRVGNKKKNGTATMSGLLSDFFAREVSDKSLQDGVWSSWLWCNGRSKSKQVVPRTFSPHQFCSVAILHWLKRRFTESWLTSTVQLYASGAPLLRFTIQGTDESHTRWWWQFTFHLHPELVKAFNGLCQNLASLRVKHAIPFIWL